MAADKLVDSGQLNGALTATADAIRVFNNEPSTNTITWNMNTGFATPIAAITSTATATASDMLSGKTAYARNTKITGNIPTKTSANMTVNGKTVTAQAGYYATAQSKSVADGSVVQNAPTINSSTGLVTATSTVTDGYVESDTKSNTLQLLAQGAQTITPGTSNKTIAAGKYLTGVQTIAGDADLVASNIKKDVAIFGVTGTFTTTPSGKTALIASALRSGYAGFINGSQVNGSMPNTTVTEGETTISGTNATRGTWNQTLGYTDARTIPAASFANKATTDTSYVDISSTTAAPVLVSGDYLYINKGYTDNLKISLAKLVPDSVNNVETFAGAGQMLSGYVAFNKDGTGITGTIPTKTSSDLTVSGATVTAPAGYYATNATKTIGNATYYATATQTTAGAITPSVALDSTATSTYGFTTTAPSGTTGTNFLTLNPEGTVSTKWKVTPKAFVSAAGYAAANTSGTAGTALEGSPTINAGTNYYVPIVGVSLDGGGLTTNTNTNTVATKPVVTVSSSGTFKTASAYGVTTTKPSGTDGTNYLTIDGSGSVTTTGKATSTVKVTRAAVTYTNSAGAIQANNAVSGLNSTNTGDITKDVNITPTVTDSFAPLYIPVVSITSSSFSGGGLTNTTNYTGTPTVTLASGTDSNMTNITISDKDETNYPYYFKVTGSTTKMTGTTKVTRAELTFSNTAGAIAANNGTQALASGISSPSVTVNAASGSKYVGLKQATMTVAGLNVVSPSISKAGCIAWGDTNNGISVTGGGTASVTATATTNAAGYAPASTQLGSAALNAPSKTTTKYLTKITVPKAQAFEVATAANTAADTKALAVTNNAYRITNVANAANGTTNVTNSGTTTVTSGSATAGSLTVSAYNSSGTAENNKSIVTNGKWVATSVSAAGTFYGRVTVGAGTVKATVSSNTDGSASMAATGFTASSSTTSYYITLSTTAGSVKAKAAGDTAGYVTSSTTNETSATSVAVSGNGNKLYIPAGSVTTSLTADGMSTYFNSGTSSDKNVTLTPKYTNTAGYKPAVTTATNNGGTAYYKIKTASPTFSAAPTGGSTATGTNCSISNTTNNSGVSVQTKYSINAVAINYAAAATGWIDKAANADTGSNTAAKSATNGTAYYINGVTMTTPSSGTRTFTVTAPSGGTNHTYTFTQDANGRTSIKVDTILTMQWNDDKQALDFIYT